MSAGAKKLVAQNRKARHNFLIEETLEAGLILTGTEVKSLRLGRCSLVDSYAVEREGELYLINAHIPTYDPASKFNHEPRRVRKLLVHRRERDKLLGLIKRGGYTLVALSLYFNERGIAKTELGLARGKKKADKREADKKRDWQRDKARLLRDRG